MRIACVYLPSFPLQVAVRNAPHLAGQPVVLVGGGDRPVVLSCSRAAHELGVRIGDGAARARALAPTAHILATMPSRERRTVEALAEGLLSLSGTIDVDSSPLAQSNPDSLDAPVDRALYLRVPHGLRGASFGAKVLAQLSRQGYRGRVGIADDRFTAWAAAVVGGRLPANGGEPRPFTQTCTTVPRGGAAAFLAPLPVSMLPMSPDMLHALSALGVDTIGAFAALPRPSIGRRRGSGLDLHALARGDGKSVLAPFSPDGPVVEQVELEHGYNEVEPLTFMLRPLLDRACERTRGRGNAIAAAMIRLHGEPSSKSSRSVLELDLRLSSPTLSGRALLDEARRLLGQRTLELHVQAMEVHVVAEADAESEDADLFERLRAGEGFELAPVMPPARDSHRRTRRGKRRRRRKSSDGRFVVQQID